MQLDKSSYKEIFRRMGYTDERGTTLLLRTQLMRAIKEELAKNNWSQAEAASVLGVKQPRIAEIQALRIDKFSVELLIRYLYRLKREVNLSLTDME